MYSHQPRMFSHNFPVIEESEPPRQGQEAPLCGMSTNSSKVLRNATSLLRAGCTRSKLTKYMQRSVSPRWNSWISSSIRYVFPIELISLFISQGALIQGWWAHSIGRAFRERSGRYRCSIWQRPHTTRTAGNARVTHKCFFGKCLGRATWTSGWIRFALEWLF